MNEMDLLKEKLREIYSETTVAHVLAPHNTNDIQQPDGVGSCQSNCGEIMKMQLKIRSEQITAAGYWTNGCAATIACGSMATDLAIGKTIKEALGIAAEDIAASLVDFPQTNFHCAELAAQTLRNALGIVFQLSMNLGKYCTGNIE